ncbi:hypothetical protein ACROYT_G027945 [Oculina patagonica]
MAVASRFVLLNDEQVKEFSESFDNENTKKKTLYDLKVFKEFLDTCDEKREIEDIAPVELQEIIKKFVLAVRKKNGEDCGVLGIHSPRALLNTLWINNCTFFGMRPGKEQRDLCWGDLQLKTDSEGNRFIEFNKERQTKTRTGENPRNIREKKPQMYENKSNADRCPVNAYLAYKDHRPAVMMSDESPFYLAVNIERPKPVKCGSNALRLESIP